MNFGKFSNGDAAEPLFERFGSTFGLVVVERFRSATFISLWLPVVSTDAIVLDFRIQRGGIQLQKFRCPDLRPVSHLQSLSNEGDLKAADFVVEIKCFVQGRQIEAFQIVNCGIQRSDQLVDGRDSDGAEALRSNRISRCDEIWSCLMLVSALLITSPTFS